MIIAAACWVGAMTLFLLQASLCAKLIQPIQAAKTPRAWAKLQVASYCANCRTSALRVGSCCGVALSLLKAKSTEGTSCAARRLVAAARRGFLSGPTSSYVQPGSLRHCVSHSKIAAVGSPAQRSSGHIFALSGHHAILHVHHPNQRHEILDVEGSIRPAACFTTLDFHWKAMLTIAMDE